MMHSKLYVGQVKHRRFAPVEHQFRYRLFMLYLDLDELPTLFDHFLLWSARGFNLAWFNRKKHLGNSDQDLKQSVIQLVQQRSGVTLDGPIRLLTHLSYFGYGFNPVSFYYCFDSTGERLQVIVAEVNNTPWNEQYCYVLDATSLSSQQPQSDRLFSYELEKAFHVSPFQPMNYHYRWFFGLPEEKLSVHMENYDSETKIFDATLQLRRQTISSASLARALLTYPLITLKVTIAIYYQALRLWLKRTPFYDHPTHSHSVDDQQQKR
jgi:DUF1365 family protein